MQDEKRRISLLLQGGLEIAIRMIVFWHNFNNIEIFRQKIESVNFQEYNDESRIFYRLTMKMMKKTNIVIDTFILKTFDHRKRFKRRYINSGELI